MYCWPDTINRAFRNCNHCKLCLSHSEILFYQLTWNFTSCTILIAKMSLQSQMSYCTVTCCRFNSQVLVFSCQEVVSATVNEALDTVPYSFSFLPFSLSLLFSFFFFFLRHLFLAAVLEMRSAGMADRSRPSWRPLTIPTQFSPGNGKTPLQWKAPLCVVCVLCVYLYRDREVYIHSIHVYTFVLQYSVISQSLNWRT